VQGITQNHLSGIAEDKTTIAILSTIKLKSQEEAMVFIKKRGFCLKASGNRYVLREGAMSLTDVLIERKSSLAEVISMGFLNLKVQQQLLC
jgi:hypothetical protein